MDIACAVVGRALIGESPIWAAAEQALYWVDIKKPALYRFEPASGVQNAWALPSDIGGFALLPDASGAVVALRGGISRLDFATGHITILAPPPFDPALYRFNEGICGEDGRFWIGVMFDPVHPDGAPPEPQPMPLHSFTLAGGLRQEHDLSTLHNGMGWSPDGRRFYISHSNSGDIFHYAMAPGGRLRQRRLLAHVDAKDGVPDGAAVDRQGGYWCALHGGGRLRRYTPDGAVDREIPLPVSLPTMCAFGGPELDDLYITSATDQLTDEKKRGEPLAGAVLRLRPGVAGLPRPYMLKL